MQDAGENEESIEFVGRICKRIHDWWFRHPWIARPFWYFILLVVVLGVCHYAFNYLNLYHTDADSARYMLSAMVQAQAAIVAIVITLTLIAVQLTASAYSPRVIDIFKKNPDMWLLLGVYGISILYGFIILKMVEGAEGVAVSQDIIWFFGCVPISFECCVSFTYWLEVFTLVALFPYMLNIIDLLKPENIINRLAIKITKDNILDQEEDPIQPIADIIHGSIMKYDIATTGYGLKTITEKAVEVVYSDGEKKISMYFCSHLERVGKLAVSREDGGSAIKVLESLEFFGESTAEKGLEVATQQAMEVLESIGVSGARKGLGDAKEKAIQALESVEKTAKQNKLKVVTKPHNIIDAVSQSYQMLFVMSAMQDEMVVLSDLMRDLNLVMEELNRLAH